MGLKQAVDDAMQRICAGSVSTHALRGESDVKPPVCSTAAFYFNPRPPRGGRPLDLSNLTAYALISIHALREEGDRRGCGGLPLLCIFQSTPSARRATRSVFATEFFSRISIHALREEGDRTNRSSSAAFSYFNPRPPRGGRRGFGDDAFAYWAFQSTLSVGRATGAGNHHPGGA